MNLEERILTLVRPDFPAAAVLRVDGLKRSAMGSAGASRENWLFDLICENGERTETRPCILRRDPPTSLLEAGLTTDRKTEFFLLRALEKHPLRTPKAYWLDETGRSLERPSLIMERMRGKATPTSTFPGYESPDLRAKLADQFVRLLAGIHAVDWRAEKLDSFMKAPADGRGAAKAQLDLWETVYRKDRTESLPVIDLAIRWLHEHLPEEGEVTLVHGDYRSGNYLYDDDGTLHAILDWELAHLGDPMEDIAWAGLKFWANRDGWASGLLPVDEFHKVYKTRSKRKIDRRRVHFYKVLGNVKMVAVCLSGVRVFCDGKRPSAQLAILGFLIPRLLEDTIRLIEKGR